VRILVEFKVRRKGFSMNAEKIQRWTNVVIVVLALSIVGAVIGEVLSPGSKTARIIGFVAFGILCIFLRALPRRLLIPKPKK
jgi:protein-S-isoprenylcysteine O-methyltransferase Ste14